MPASLIDTLDLVNYSKTSWRERIIDGRPYAKVEDLKKVKGIGEKTLEKIRDQVIVK